MSFRSPGSRGPRNLARSTMKILPPDSKRLPAAHRLRIMQPL